MDAKPEHGRNGRNAWTFRRENYFLPLGDKGGLNPAAHGDLGAEIAAYLATGIDGLFSDNVREAVAATKVVQR